ncbi:hypothetical protein KAN5_16410 [Pseudoalteromonas sp. KAN5]|nr:hypothetical protein KAN5_16410 [Pseudoalteromonas sp. KAN5]
MPKPIARLITVKVTGKVKLTAAKGSVPSKLIKNVSTILNIIKVIIPKIIGIVIFFNVGTMGAFNKSGAVLVCKVARMGINKPLLLSVVF